MVSPMEKESTAPSRLHFAIEPATVNQVAR
jgi:hypothetical protein